MAELISDTGLAEQLFIAALLASAAALWLSPPVALGLLVMAALAGLASGLVAPTGLIVLAVFAAACAIHGRERPSIALWFALATAAALMFLHVAPGFDGLRVIGPERIGSGAEYEKWIALDKVGAGILLLALALPVIHRRGGLGGALGRAGPVIVGTAIGVPFLAFVAGLLGWDVTPDGFILWAIFNLLTVCLPEEALFRGLLQTRLVREAASRGLSAHLAIVASAVIFGLAHAPGGPALILASSIAGLGYGYAYWIAGRIEAAILCHFGLNAVHYLFFTYPYPAA